jgi:hypothetical protein
MEYGKLLSRHSLETLKKTMKASVRRSDRPTEILTRYLTSKNLKPHRYSNMFGGRVTTCETQRKIKCKKCN